MKRWKSRFRQPLDAGALTFSSSLEVDRRLADEDIEGSLAHVAMLGDRRIIPAAACRAITRGLREIRREIAGGDAAWLRVTAGGGRFVAEDIHMAIEQRLATKTGAAGAWLHTARSRNDQVALDERLYLRKTIDRVCALLRSVQRSLVRKAGEYHDVIMPGYTHLQRAQPILLAHHLLAYTSMFDRDWGRFLDCRRRANFSPLGAAALAGTSFPIDRKRVARSLGFDGIVENSIDAVSDRDALLEFLAASAITMMHASRLAEDLLLWSSQEWGFAEVGDAFATGSSIMPQKKNPDMAELIRGKAGRVYGDLVALLTVMKGLPLAYNRDMQEDKQPVFDAADTLLLSLDVLARMMESVSFNRGRFEEELDADLLLATELADYLARKGVPFREAHGIVGELAGMCRDRKCSFADLPLREYTRRTPAFGRDLAGVLNARASLAMKRSAGSTAPREVAASLRRWLKVLG